MPLQAAATSARRDSASALGSGSGSDRGADPAHPIASAPEGSQ
jgi:hypothetical protein